MKFQEKSDQDPKHFTSSFQQEYESASVSRTIQKTLHWDELVANGKLSKKQSMDQRTISNGKQLQPFSQNPRALQGARGFYFRYGISNKNGAPLFSNCQCCTEAVKLH